MAATTGTAYLIDASIYIFRAYFSLPENWHSAEGYPLNAVYGYTGFLLDILPRLGPAPVYCAAAFDESLGSCFRNELYGNYKVSRELPDEALAYQLAACRQVSELLGLPCFSGQRFEADDYIATLSQLAHVQQLSTCVVTRDKDLGQLLRHSDDVLWDFAAGERMQRGDFFAKFGVHPEQFADFLGLVGDSSDDIPGVPAIGAKTAARLLQAYGDLEHLRYNLDQLPALGIRGAARIAGNLREYWQQALLSRSLAQLAFRIPDVQLPAPFQLHSEAVQALLQYLEELQISGPIVRRCETLVQRLSTP